MKNTLTSNSSSGIFLLYEGLPPTIIESQVLAHARSMGEAGVQMEVWAFACTPNHYTLALTALPRLLKTYPTVVIRLFRGIKPALPFSEWLNALLLLWWMWRLDVRPSFVHARTEHATMIAAIARRAKKYRLIWDARGDTVSEFSETAQYLPKLLWWLVPLKMRAISKRLKISACHSDYAIFVSNALRSLQGGELPIERTMVVPCLADESLFYFDQKLREKARCMLGYNDNDIVITYVGSTSTWQCVAETIALMERALRANPVCKALIVTPTRSAFESSFANDLLDRVCITSGGLKDMNRYLNAADFGVLLRKPNAINWVASPVKFAEYSLTGLVVVTTDAVEQVKEIGRRLGNTVDANEFMSLCERNNYSPTTRLDIAGKAQAVLGRKSQIDKLVQFYNGLMKN